jgi:hypothetical protein
MRTAVHCQSAARHCCRQPIRSKNGFEHALHLLEARYAQRLTMKQIATETITDGERITRVPSCLEMPLEIGGPNIVSALAPRERLGVSRHLATSPSRPSKPVGPKYTTNCARSRNAFRRVQRLQMCSDFPGAPIRIGLSHRDNQLCLPSRDCQRASMRSTRAILEPSWASPLVASEPLVPCLSANPEPATEARHAFAACTNLEHKSHSFFHVTRLFPGHELAPLPKQGSVNKVPGLKTTVSAVSPV